MFPLQIVAKPDFEVNNMHQRTEDWLERNVNGIIGWERYFLFTIYPSIIIICRYLPKTDQDAEGSKTVWKIVNYKDIVH